MARGWESKSIESQQDDARAKAVKRPELTPDERERLQRRTGLELALAQAQAEFECASQPAHREMLRLKMEALRTELAELD